MSKTSESLKSLEQEKLGSTVAKRSQSSNSGSLKSNSEDFEKESIQSPEQNPLSQVLLFDYSFGYDCRQHFNLCAADDNTLVFYSGTLIHFFNIAEKKFMFKKTKSGSGIGHITKNTNLNHLAVGEKGTNPLIVVYEWPSFDIISQMAGGTTFAYSHLGYSPDGTMLVSQGKEPDHLITIWDWKQATIILRVKSHGQDVFNVEFSQFVPGQLTTCGLGHIKFWKMANTFTGLKLQGELGRFGKMEICDILGICAMPDEKVISGCEWGDLLAWDDRLIKLEMRQKAHGFCHDAAISQIHFNNNTQDIISVGMDGWIKLWTRATIDTADPPDEEDWFLEMQPLYELEVQDKTGHARLMSLCKKNDNLNDNDWFAQDGDGGIWSLSLYAEDSHPVRLFTCHAGEVVDMAASPLGLFLATLGANGYLLLHDVVSRELLLSHHFPASGNCLLWFPLNVEASGAVLAGGFGDGVLRVFVLSIRELQRTRLSIRSSISNASYSECINVIQRVKSHNGPVTFLSLNPRGTILVSGDSCATIFVHQILPKREYIVLTPIGFVDVPAAVTYIAWQPDQKAMAVVACEDGSVTEVGLPERASSYSSATYSLNLDSRTIRFKSVKSELLHAQELRDIEVRKQAKLEKKQGELDKIKVGNPNLDIDEEMFLMDSDEELEFPPLLYPETPSPVLFVLPLPGGNLLLSMGSFDCGYLYEYSFGLIGPVCSDPLPEALNTPALCQELMCEGRVLVLGMSTGTLRLVVCERGRPDNSRYYELGMHDPERGMVRRLCHSCDDRYLFSCGSDGSIFSYLVNPEALPQLEEEEEIQADRIKKLSRRRASSVVSASVPQEIVEDMSGDEEPSLEDTKKNAEHLNQLKLANEHKENIRRKLANLHLNFEFILERNLHLPESQILPHSIFELDPRIAAALHDKITADNNLMMCKIAFKVARSRLLVKKMQNHFVDKIASLDVTVRAIKNEDLRIKAFTHNKLTPEFLRDEENLRDKSDLKTIVSQMTTDMGSRGLGSVITIPRTSALGSILKVQPFYNKLTLKARKAFIKQCAARTKKDVRAQQWQMFLDKKPDINADDPSDIVAFELATQTIGDFQLKSAQSYKVPEEKRITPAKKYWQLLSLHREIFEKKVAFNVKVCEIRNSKISLLRRFKQLYSDLDLIQRELTPVLRRERLSLPKCYLIYNFPEHIFRLEFGADPTLYSPVSPSYDEEFYVLKVDVNKPVSADVSQLNMYKWNPETSFQELLDWAADDAIDTPWEHEVKVVRMIRLLYEQDTIIKEMRSGIDKFDDALESLCIDRLTYARDIKLMEIFQLTLHQELVVINSYAGQEEDIRQRINTSVSLRNEKLKQKTSILDFVDAKQQDIVMWQAKLVDLQEEIVEKLLNNKFASFLNRLFKKKRSVKRSDDSDSESSSSEDDTDEDYDDDDEDFVPLKLDENVCPEGCDPDLYEDVLYSRKLRYDMEDNIAEIRRLLDDHQKELTVGNKDLVKLELDVQATINELEDVQFDKQQKLNIIESVVVLNLSQFRHFENTSHPEDGLVPDPLVFHSEALFTLSGRVRELEKETEEQHVRIRQQKQLMSRLSKRCKDMKEMKKQMKKAINQEIINKFSELIDIEQMEDTVLRKMLSQARRDYLVDQLRIKYDKIIAQSKSERWKKTADLIAVEKENTRRLKLQTMLEQETLKLTLLLRHLVSDKDKVVSLMELTIFEEDIHRLEEILNSQMEICSALKEEIRILSYKETPPKKNISSDKDLENDLRDVSSTEVNVHGSIEEIDDPWKTESTKNKSLQITDETFKTIDKVLLKLASGNSAYDTALYLVEEMLFYIGDEGQRSSALEVALRLVDELVQITSQDEAGDIAVVELCTAELLEIASDRQERLLSSTIFEEPPCPDVE